MKKLSLIFLLFAFFPVKGEEDPVSLYGVHAPSEKTAYAVGNLGTAYKTADGGRTWKKLAVPVKAVLQRCHFVTEDEGWIVGGTERYLSTGGVGVVLHTADGGRTWDVSYPGAAGWLLDVYFLDRKRGWICGAANDQMDDALYETHDGGKSWKWMKTGRMGWLYGLSVLKNGERIVAGTENGYVACIEKKAQPETLEVVRPRRAQTRYPTIRSVFFFDGQAGCAVGDNCAIGVTEDGGKTWEAGETDLNNKLQYDMDIRDVCFTEKNIGYAVGSVGNVVLTTVSGGKKWKALPSPRRSWLWGVSFSDMMHGIAVGDMGTIIITNDGGRSWQDKSLASEKLDVLFILAHHDDDAGSAALSAFLALNEGYRIGVCFTSRDDRRNLYYTGEPTFLEGRSAVNAIGCLPVRTYEELKPYSMEMDEAENKWAEDFGEDGQEMMNRMMTAAVRAYRPDVIVTHEPVFGDYNKPCHKLSGRAGTAAFQRAGDPQQHPEQVEIGLSPWQAKRLYYRTRPRLNGRPSSGEHAPSIAFETGFFLPSLQTTPAVYAQRNWLRYKSKQLKMREIPVAEYYHLKYALDDEYRPSVLPEKYTPKHSERDENYLKMLRKPVDQMEALVRRYSEDINSGPYMEDALNRVLVRDIGKPEGEDNLRRLLKFQSDTASALLVINEHLEGLFRSRRIEVARNWIDVLLALGKNRGEFVNRSLVRGTLMFRCQMYTEAQKEFTECLKRTDLPAGVVAMINTCLGVIRRLAGQNKEAEAYFKAGAAADGGGAWQKTAASELYFMTDQGEIQKKKVRAARLKKRVSVDAADNDADWERTDQQEIAIPVRLPESEAAFQRSEVRLLYDDEAVYVFGRFFEERMEQCRSAPAPEKTFDNDVVTFFFDPGRSLNEWFEISLKPFEKAPAFSPNFPEPGRSPVEAKIRFEREAWCVELKIPRKAFFRFEDAQIFGFNMARDRRADFVQKPAWPATDEFTIWEMSEPTPDQKAPQVSGYLILE